MSRSFYVNKSNIVAFLWRGIPVRYMRLNSKKESDEYGERWVNGDAYTSLFSQSRLRKNKGTPVLPCVALVGCSDNSFIVWCFYSRRVLFFSEFEKEVQAQSFALGWSKTSDSEAFVKENYHKLFEFDGKSHLEHQGLNFREDSFYFFGWPSTNFFSKNIYMLVSVRGSDSFGGKGGRFLSIVPEQRRDKVDVSEPRIKGNISPLSCYKLSESKKKEIFLRSVKFANVSPDGKKDALASSNSFDGKDFMRWVDVSPYAPDPVSNGFCQCNRCGDYYRKGKKAGHPCDPKLRETGYLAVLSSAEALEKCQKQMK